MEEKVAALERENFNLKMRIFYLNNKLNNDGNDQNIMSLENGYHVDEIMQERTMGLIQLKASYNDALRRIDELESEIIQLKILNSTEMVSNNNIVALPKNPIHDTLKKERQAALSIAEHDATLIRVLEKEIMSLRDKHEADKLLLSECSQNEIKLRNIIIQKEKEIEEKTYQLNSTATLLDIMQDKIHNHNIATRGHQSPQDFQNSSQSNISSSGMNNPNTPPSTLRSQKKSISFSEDLNNSHHHHGISFQSNTSSGNSIPQSHLPSNPHQSIFPYDTTTEFPTASSFSQSTPLVLPNGSNIISGANMSFIASNDRSHPFTSSASNAPYFTSSTNTPMNKSLLSQSNNHMNSTFNRSPVTPLQVNANSSTSAASSAYNPLQSNYLSRPLVSDPAAAAQGTVIDLTKPNSILHQALAGELLLLRRENSMLKQQIGNDHHIITTQQNAINKVQSSAEEITLLEAEEVARLQKELDRLSYEKDKLILSCKKSEGMVAVLKQKLKFNERYKEEELLDLPEGGLHYLIRDEDNNNSNSNIDKNQSRPTSYYYSSPQTYASSAASSGHLGQQNQSNNNSSNTPKFSGDNVYASFGDRSSYFSPSATATASDTAPRVNANLFNSNSSTQQRSTVFPEKDVTSSLYNNNNGSDRDMFSILKDRLRNY